MLVSDGKRGMADQWCAVAPVIDIRIGPSLWMVRDREVLVVRETNRFFAIDDSCPHAGASLSNGRFEIGHVRCRVHGLLFHLGTGRCAVGDLALTLYACRVHDEQLEIKLATPDDVSAFQAT